MNPQDLQYTKSHEWVKIEGDTATIGITQYAADELGDVVYLALPKIGDRVEKEGAFGSIESVKAVSDLVAPFTGEIVEVNDDLADTPEVVNESPYERAWMVRIRLDDPSQTDELMNAQVYERLLEG